jgi:uncharacterized protein involved in type VI secretion and phage assembly
VSDVITVLRAIVREEMSRYRQTEIGVVTDVFPKADDSGPDNHQVNVKLRGSGVDVQRAAVAVSCAGVSALPRKGDLVVVAFDGGDLNAPVVLGSVYGSKTHPPKAGPLELVYQPPDGEDSSVRRVHIELPSGNLITFDDDKLTVQCGGTEVVVNKDGDVSIASNAKVSISAQGDIELSAQGNLSLSAQQNVTIKGLSSTLEGQASATVKGPQVSLAGLANFSPS